MRLNCSLKIAWLGIIMKSSLLVHTTIRDMYKNKKGYPVVLPTSPKFPRFHPHGPVLTQPLQSIRRSATALPVYQIRSRSGFGVGMLELLP